MVLPFAAAANSSAIQSVITPVLTQVQTLFSAADDVFVPNEAPAVAASGISPFSASNIRLEATTFSAGFTHSLALHSNGTLWAWGSNGNGRTGLGTITGNQLTPAQVGTAANWTQVSAGNNFSLALRSGGTLWSWGSNADGVTGLGTTVGNQLTPEQVGTAANWTAVSAGSEHSLAIRSDGTLWAWGQNTGGRTGLGVLLGTETTPVQVGTATNWAHVSAGQTHSLAVRSDGTLWAWGSHTNGVTGLGTSSGNQTTPAQVGTATNWSAVSAGSAHSLAIRADGTLWSWGSNVGGRTGLGATTGTQTTPVQVGTATDWTTLSAGNAHSIAIRSDGTLWSWGSNTVGRTGLGTTIGSQTTPIQVGSATDWTLADAGTAGSHSLGMRTNGDLWGWGYNVNGQIGLNDIGDRTVPTLIGSGFETGLERDFEPPTIENIAPQGSGVATTTAQIVITFDQAMHTESLGTVRLNNTELDLTHAVWTENDTVLTIPLTGLLTYATRYEVEVEGFRGEMGRLLAEAFTHAFVTEAKDLDLAITKDLQMPEGTAVPDTNFIFDITAYSYNGETTAPEMADMPDLSVNPVAFSSTDVGTLDGDTITITRWSDFLLGNDLPFPFAGLFVYRTSERNDTFSNTEKETMLFDPTIYQITFQVENLPSPASGLFVRAIFLQLVVDGVPGDKIDITDNLTDALVFNNIFIRNHDNEDPLDPAVLGGLQISKTVEGALANQARFFDFDVSIWIPSLLTTPTAYRAYVLENIAGVPTVVTASDNGTIFGSSANGDYLLFSHAATQTISLRHGQSLVFAGTHVGVRYSVTEQAVANYIPSVAVLTNGQAVTVAPADAANTALTVPAQILGEATNRAAFTNEHSTVIESGLDVGNFGLALLLLAIVSLLVIVTATRRGKREMELQVLTH